MALPRADLPATFDPGCGSLPAVGRHPALSRVPSLTVPTSLPQAALPPPTPARWSMPRPILCLLGPPPPPHTGFKDAGDPAGCLRLGSHAPQLHRFKADLTASPLEGSYGVSLGKGHWHLPSCPTEPWESVQTPPPVHPPYPVNHEVLPVVFPQPRHSSAAACRPDFLLWR